MDERDEKHEMGEEEGSAMGRTTRFQGASDGDGRTATFQGAPDGEARTVRFQGASDGDGRERLVRLMGDEGLDRLACARVLVVGIGGVGSNCAEALVRGGVGAIALCDGDVVAPSNINRQSIAFTTTIGLPKVEVMAAMARQIDPDIRVDRYRHQVMADEVADFLDEVGPCDWVVDACDMVSTKLALAEECQRRGQPIISSMGGANKVHPERIAITTLERTVRDPLARIMRKEARRRGIHDLLVASSDEEPLAVAPAPGASRRDRSDLGTASFLPPVMGLMIAGEVIRRISGVGL